MKPIGRIFYAVYSCLVLVKLLSPVAALAQETDSSGHENVVYYEPDAKVLGAKFAFQSLFLAVGSSSISPEAELKSGGPRYADTWMQSVTFEWDWDRANSAVAYDFSAPSGQYPHGMANGIASEYWTSSVVSGTTVYLAKSKAVAADLSTDWETRGQKLRAGRTPAVLGQSFTMEWGITQLLPLNQQMTKLLEFGVAGYDEWLDANNCDLPASGLSLRNGHFSIHAVGFQSNLILPAKNLSLSFKYEPAYLAAPPASRHVIMFGASWTW